MGFSPRSIDFSSSAVEVQVLHLVFFQKDRGTRGSARETVVGRRRLRLRLQQGQLGVISNLVKKGLLFGFLLARAGKMFQQKVLPRWNVKV